MSEPFVVDASVGMAWALASQSSAATDILLEARAAGTPVIVPVHWHFEVANALLMLLRRKKILPQEKERAVGALGKLQLAIDTEGPDFAFIKISDMAAEHELTIYDAVYLELALRRKLPLATRDEALSKAARDCQVKLLL